MRDEPKIPTWKLLRLFRRFAITRSHFYRDNHHSWCLDVSYIDKFSILLRFFSFLSPSFSLPLVLIFKSIRSSSWCSFSSSVKTSLCRGSMFAIRDRAAATRIMTRDAEVELAEKKCGARAGSFFCLFHLFSVLLFLTRQFSQILFLSLQFHIRNPLRRTRATDQ